LRIITLPVQTPEKSSTDYLSSSTLAYDSDGDTLIGGKPDVDCDLAGRAIATGGDCTEGEVNMRHTEENCFD
jgi:hypothetical protein